MIRRLLAFVVLLAACTPDSPDLSAEEQEIEECFGANAPGVPASAASGRGFTADELRVVLFGPAPDAEPAAPGEPSEQLLTLLDVFAGLSRADYDALEDELDFLDGFFSAAATSVALAPRLAAASVAAKQAPQKLRLAPAALADAYRVASHNPCREVTRSTGTLTLTLACGGASGAVVFAGPDAVLDGVAALLEGSTPNISTAVRETLTITFKAVAITSPQGESETVVDGTVAIAFDMAEFTIRIDEATDDTTIKLAGTVEVAADGVKLKTVDALTRATRESGALSLKLAARFNVDAVNTFERDQTLDGTGTTRSTLRVSQGAASIKLASLDYSLGKTSASASATLAVDAAAEGEDYDETDGGVSIDSTERLAVSATFGLSNGALTAKSPKGTVQLSLGAKGSVKLRTNGQSQGRYDTPEGARGTDENSTAFKLACGYAGVQVDRAAGGSSQSGLRLHLLAGNDARGAHEESYVDAAEYGDRSYDEHEGTSYLKNLVVKVDLLGKSAAGALPRWVESEQSNSRHHSEYSNSTWETSYSNHATTVTELDTAGYVSFAGKPYLARIVPDFKVIENEQYYDSSNSNEDYLSDPQAVGALQVVSGSDTLEFTQVRKDSPRPHLVNQYTLNGATLASYDPYNEGPGLPNDPYFLLTR